MSTPDVRVRLSPEGIKEVLFGLREVQKEALKANKASAAGIGVVSSAVKDLKSILPSLGLAAVVSGFLAMSKQALQTADQTGKLQLKVGGTVEEVSGLTLAFKTNESNQEGLQAALLKTANVIAQVRAGSTETADALRSIGVDAEALTELSTPRALEEIAKKLQAIPPGADRANAAFKIFGKQSGDLITALDAVGAQGIDAFIAKAKEMGVLIDDDLAGAAARANDSLGIIKIQAQGLATQFAAGLAPAVADAMEAFNESITGEGVNGMRKFGEVVGFVVRLVTTLFVGMGKVIGAQVAKLASFVGSAKDAATSIAGGDFSGALEAVRRGARERLAIETELQADLAALGKKLIDGPAKAEPRSQGGSGAGVDAPDSAEAKKNADARAAFLKSQLDNEVKLQQEALKFAEQEAKAAYERGLLSLSEYYAARRALAQRGAQAEADALKIERAAVAEQLSKVTGNDSGKEAERIKLRQQLAALTAEIQQKEVAAARELAAINNEEFEATKALGEERAASIAKLAEAENDRHAVFMANLETEIRQIRELGARAGQSAEEIEATVARFTAARTGQFNVESATREGTQALQAFQRDAEQIRRDMEAGVLSQIEGEQRLIELMGSRVGVLQEISTKMQEVAALTGDAEQIEKAQQFADSIDQIAASYRAATDVGAQFRQGGIEAFQGGVQSLLQNVQNIKSVEDAFRSLGLAVAEEMQRIASEILSKQATLALMSAFKGASAGGGAGAAAGAETAAAAAQTAQLQIAATTLATAGATVSTGAAATAAAATALSASGATVTSGAASLAGAALSLSAAAAQLQIANTIGAASSVAGAYRGGYVRGYAGGGDIAGKPLRIPGPDKIPILAQKGEFMLRKSVVQRPGMLDFLRRLNSGQLPSARAVRVRGYAKGGEIGAGTGASTAGAAASQPSSNSLRIINVLDPEMVNEALASPAGEKTMINVIQRNSSSIKRMLS